MAEPLSSGAEAVRADVTERKRAEHALRRSEAYLAIAQSLSHTGSFGWDIAKEEIFWSQETYRIFELAPGTKPTLDFIRQRVHPEDQALAEEIFARMSESCQRLISKERAVEKGDLHFEHRLLMPDGSVKCVRVSGRAVRNPSGDPEFVGAVTDITEAKRAEREALKREAKIRRLVDANIIGIGIWDSEGTTIEANDAFLKMLGYDRDDLNAGRMRWRDMTPPEWLKIDDEQSIPELNATGRLHPIEKEFFRKDGTRVPVLVGAATFDEGKEGVAFVLDLTERKRAEESLALTSFALNNVREAAYLIDENSRFHYVNEETCRALGYTREELRGMCVPDVNPDFPVERWPDEWARRKSKRSLIFESRHRAKDGRVFPVEINSNFIEYDGQAYVLGLVRDISERKRAEEATLEARVSERTRIARELHDTLLQSFQALLLRFQAAYLRLPEHPIEAKQRLDSAIKQAADAITEGRDAVQALRESTVQSNDLARAIRSLGEELANDTTNHSPVGFHLSVEGEPRNLHPIVRDEIYKITAESIRNAFRHADAKQIAVRIHYEDEQVRLRVRDDGRGIDPEVLSRKASEGHYGIAGMRERATIIGGKFELRSQLGGGTEIELCVPGSKAYATAERSSYVSSQISGVA